MESQNAKAQALKIQTNNDFTLLAVATGENMLLFTETPDNHKPMKHNEICNAYNNTIYIIDVRNIFYTSRKLKQEFQAYGKNSTND